MASIVPGYENDIFISYRQKDNKYDGWVTEFVGNLRKELEATFKEDITIYFDENPHDGLLDHHDVNRSLEGKLNCLVFLPIISQTYCDPRSFAWQFEFKRFAELTRTDTLGQYVELQNGNQANRILPIIIHQLDAEDENLLESVLQTKVRGIDFTYRSPGINRPLTPADTAHEHAGRTTYRNQLNKTANAIKDLVRSIQHGGGQNRPMIHPTSFGRQDVLEKSIVVLPFVNISNDPDQEYFSDGLTEEIIADLSKIHDLLVISRSSSMTFKGTSKKIKEIAQDVNVKYVLEGSVRKAGNQIRVTAQLINATADTHLWSDKYTGVLDDVFDIQEKVSKAIVNELKIKLTEKESREISVHPIDNAVSYDFYLKARTYFLQWTKESTDQALALLQNAEELIGPNPTLYAGKAYAHWSYANLGIEPKANTQLSEQYVDKVFQLEPENPDGHLILGLLYQAFRGNPKLANHHFNRVLASRPHDYDALLWKYANYFTLGKMDAARKTLSKLTRLDPLSTISTCAEGWILMYEGKYSQSLPILKAAMEKEPSGIYKIFYGVALGCSGDFTALIDFLNRMPKLEEGHFGTIFTVFKELMQGDIDAARRDLNEDAWEWLKRDFQFSHLMAEIYCMAKQKEDTYKFLENAMSKGFCNYPLLSGPSPIYSLLHDEVRFQNLLVTMKQLWDEFETD